MQIVFSTYFVFFGVQIVRVFLLYDYLDEYMYFYAKIHHSVSHFDFLCSPIRSISIMKSQLILLFLNTNFLNYMCRNLEIRSE